MEDRGWKIEDRGSEQSPLVVPALAGEDRLKAELQATRDPLSSILDPRFLEDPISRRKFLTLLGASLSLAGLNGCSVRPPAEKIVPYVRSPEELVLGKPLFFATAMPLGGLATGLLVESHEGRPTKVEGNPDHPASLGATDIFAQASMLTLYDPDRSQTVKDRGRIQVWDNVVVAIQSALAKLEGRKGAGLRFLTGAFTSPTLAQQMAVVLQKFPEARWHVHEPISRESARAGARLAFGDPLHCYYRFDQADVFLSLDADFLGSGPGQLRYVRDFMAKRKQKPGEPPAMNRLYVIESTPTLTGAKADHRWSLRPSQIERFARALAAELASQLRKSTKKPPDESAVAILAKAGTQESEHLGNAGQWIEAIVQDLIEDESKRSRLGKTVIVAGDEQSPVVHALAHAMNFALGNADKTVIYTDPLETDPVDGKPFPPRASLEQLTRDMDKGAVELLLILDGNPVYTAPTDLEFRERLKHIPLRIHLGLYEDETAELCHWHIPRAHFLESWGDCRAYDGTATIMQPLIAPLYGGRTVLEMLQVVTGQTGGSDYEIVKNHWRRFWEKRIGTGTFESFWQTALHDGVVPETKLPARDKLTLKMDWADAPPRKTSEVLGDSGSLEIVFRPDPTIYDGQFANNGWLQELPKPLTKLTWDNAALVSPATAEKLGLTSQIGVHGGEHGEALVDVVELTYRDRALRVPAWVMPGQPEACVTLHLGYGRTRAGQVGTGAGFNAYALRTSEALWFDSGLEVKKTGERFLLACTQQHHRMEGRELVRSGNLSEYRAKGYLAPKPGPQGAGLGNEGGGKGGGGGRKSLTLYDESEHKYQGYKWGMAIDLTSCIGCNACITACQAENNIPVVGKDQVTRGREMHWLRVDLYDQGNEDKSRTYFQPVPCMHCENAPCELVCPVEATVHSSEGLNDMVYNRCVGTRYCSNNCPYKVRRFNFLQFSDYATNSLKLLRNPDVTVRTRGVMEKCTYCVQRINRARIEADKEGRPIRDGEILTACQAVCPAQAIVFGNLNDPNSKVSTQKAQPLNYALLEELNTRPRTTYLTALRNPNPRIED
jgi:molybdopterin-containing oxidoreductase family iron-sulfur binding subunit